MIDIKFRQPIRNKNGKFIEWFFWGFIDGQWIQWAIQQNGIDTRKESQRYSGLKDKLENEIFEGDIIELTNSDGEIIRKVCEFGIARRKMDSGFVCDIPSFYFLVDERQTFPIVNNYAGLHDLQLFKIVGNIYQNPKMIKNILN